ncbi:helix-turn-helix domain-containing protein [Algoriphagus boritolerans]|uniref:helix-turn-helix domain-containing protein n=1 Tax=Algoriphagus boritolerans TaxID=308111 RepID=UPI003A102405
MKNWLKSLTWHRITSAYSSKKHVGESIKQYITNYKFGLIEARLTYSKLTLSEIAHEFSFTDESHFCRQFKKYSGITPTEFRRRNLPIKKRDDLHLLIVYFIKVVA